MAYMIRQTWVMPSEGCQIHYYCSNCTEELNDYDDIYGEYTPCVCPKCGAPLKRRREEFGYWKPEDKRVWLLNLPTKHVHKWVCSECGRKVRSSEKALPLVCPSCECFMCVKE